MEQVGLLLLGGLVTGGGALLVARLETKRATQTEIKVAARVILGDLYVMEGACEVLLSTKIWPDRMDLNASFTQMLESWAAERAAFARGARAAEWARVDGVYSNGSRTFRRADPGEQCSPNDLASLEALEQMLPRAKEIVLLRAADEKERDALVEEFTTKTDFSPRPMGRAGNHP